MGKIQATCLAAACWAVLGGQVCLGDEPGAEDIQARLQRLEEQNASLRKWIEGKPRLTFAAADPDLPLPKDAKTKDPETTKTPAKFVEVGADLRLTATWRDGLFLATPNNDFKVQVGGRVHQDWVWFTADDALAKEKAIGPLDDGVFFRRARLRVGGTAYEIMDWVAEFEFAVSTDVVPRNVWVQLTQLPWVGNVRAGHFREPFSLERMTSGRDITFLERSPVDDAFVPAFSIGMMLWDAPFEERMTWAAGIFRNTPEPDSGIDAGDGDYAGTGRVTFLPWYQDEGRALLHLGAAYSHRHAEFDAGLGADGVRFRARPSVRAARPMPRLVDTGALLADATDLFGAEAALVLGPWSLQAECIRSAVAADGGDFAFHGYYVMASCFLTGEHRPYDRRGGAFGRVRPYENFWLVRNAEAEGPPGCSLGRGAWEIAARYSWLDLNDSGIKGGVLEDLVLGLNWYLNPNFHIQWNYILARRTVEAPLASGQVQALAMRLALEF